MADERAQVVISGAGPNGLMLACELALAGIRPVVLDQLPGPSSEPKANGLVGQVVRMLDMRGLYQAFTGDDEPPQPAYGWIFAAMPLNFLGLPDNPMYAMLMPQPRLVRLLEKRARDLGVDLRWGHELVGLQQEPESVALTVSSPERDYGIAAGYLVGADGGHSLVRKTLSIDFPGTTSPMVSRLAHVHIPEQIRRADGGIDIPGFGRLPVAAHINGWAPAGLLDTYESERHPVGQHHSRRGQAHGRAAGRLRCGTDGYIAWAGDTFGTTEKAGLRAALQRWFGPESRG